MSQHSTGPWTCSGRYGMTIISEHDRKKNLVAEVTYEEDALLVAAAPDLLAACRAIIAWDNAEKAGPDYGTQTRDTHPSGEAIWQTWWGEVGELCRVAFDSARAAIAKATGEQP